MNTKKLTKEPERKILTSANCPELADKIKAVSARVMERNYKLYKALENK